MTFFIDLPQEINWGRSGWSMWTEGRYITFCHLRTPTVPGIKLSNYLSTVNSQVQDKIKLDLSDETPTPLWSFLHTDLSGRIIYQGRTYNPWLILLLTCIPNRHMVHHCSSHFLQNCKVNKATKIDHRIVDMLTGTSWVNYLISLGLTLYVKWE